MSHVTCSVGSYQTGRIAQLCANADEPVWVLNFKRGVLSTLVTMVSLEPTEESIIYEVSGNNRERIFITIEVIHTLRKEESA